MERKRPRDIRRNFALCVSWLPLSNCSYFPFPMIMNLFSCILHQAKWQPSFFVCQVETVGLFILCRESVMGSDAGVATYPCFVFAFSCLSFLRLS